MGTCGYAGSIAGLRVGAGEGSTSFPTPMRGSG